MNELALFAGAGGGILGGKLLGWRTVCAVEWEQYPASVLVQRQNDGFLPPFPIWDDVRTFDGNPWRGVVDVVSGGFPCQDISPANNNGKGIDGERSGLWTEFKRIIGEVKPRWVLVENSAHLRTKGLGRVLKDLALIGYDAAWGVLSAEDCGANHERKRMWIVAHPSRIGRQVCGALCPKETSERAADKSESFCSDVSNTNSIQCEGRRLPGRREQEHPDTGLGSWWKDQPAIHRVDDGVAYRMDRLKAVGNGQVPIVAATAFKQLSRFLTCAHNDKMLLKEIERL